MADDTYRLLNTDTGQVSVVDALASNDHELVEGIVLAQEQVKQALEVRDRLTFEAERRMLERRATAIDHPTIECILKHPSPTYDYRLLVALKEEVSDQILFTGYTPAHEETVPVKESWDMRVVKTWRKYGSNIGAILDMAVIPGQPRVQVKVKK